MNLKWQQAKKVGFENAKFTYAGVRGRRTRPGICILKSRWIFAQAVEHERLKKVGVCIQGQWPSFRESIGYCFPCGFCGHLVFYRQ